MSMTSDTAYFEALRQVWLAVRELRSATQRAAAEAMELEPSLLSKWERGETTRLQEKTHDKLIALLREWNAELPPDRQLDIPSRQAARDLAAYAAYLPAVGTFFGTSAAAGLLGTNALAGSAALTALGGAAALGGPAALALGGAAAGATLKKYLAGRKKKLEQAEVLGKGEAIIDFHCPHEGCGEVVPGPSEGAKFCICCGKPFVIECKTCGQYCPIVDAKFCPHCGSSLVYDT